MDAGSSAPDDGKVDEGDDLPFRQLAQHLATPCWISDAEGRIVWVNDAWIDYTGAPVETIEAEGLKGLHDPAVYGDVVRKWEAVRAAGVADEMDFPLRGKDGGFRLFRTRVTPLRDRAGNLQRWFGTNTDVSAQAETEARLQTSQEQLREVFDRAADAIFITDPGGRLVDVNAAASAMTGFTREELLARSVWQLIGQDEQAALAQARDRDDSVAEWRIRRKDGAFLELEVSSRRLSDGRRLGVARDISARRLAERAARQALTDQVNVQTARASDAERQLQRFWDASRDLFAIVSNTDGVPRLINERAWRDTLGYPAGHITSTRLLDLVHPEDRARTLAMRVSHLDQSAYFGFENRYLHRDGHVVWLSWNVVRDGEMIYCNGRDVTLEKLAQDSLARSERQFELLVSGVVDYALLMLNPDGTVANWNSGGQRIKGYTADEIVGRHISLFYTEADRAADRPAIGLRTAAAEGRYEAEGWRVRKDGSLFWANVVIDAIRDEDGKLVGFAKITRDITERRNAQLDLQKANERLAHSQKMEALGQLTGGVAHDFNNLLMVVGGQAELMRDRVGEDPRALRSLDAIMAATRRGQELTRHLLAFARRQRLYPASVSLAAQAPDLQALLASSLGVGVSVGVDCPDDLWPVEIDINAWELAMLNMAVNARDAMPAGGRLTISARNASLAAGEIDPDLTGDFVELTVADTGVGIPDDILPRVIDPFFTTKGADKGTGLGLSQVDGFVQQSGGRLRVESRLGEGTTIRIWLPRATSAPVEPEVAPASATVKSLQVLCVEDNAEVADAAAGLLEHLGHIPRVVSSAAAALQILEAGGLPDLVFSDIVMAGALDGLGLARRIRATWPDLPVLLATGYSREAEVIGNEFPILAKPYQAGELSHAINTVMAAAGG